MSAFAPGPWVTDPELGHEMVLDANGVLVADCSIVHRQRTTSQCVAHAALMAAAPELFDALNALVNAVSPDDNDKSCEPYFRPALKAARAALAKARGAQS